MKLKINPVRFFKFNNFIVNKNTFGLKNTITQMNKIIPIDLLSSIEHDYKHHEIRFYFLNNTSTITTTCENSFELYDYIVKQLASNKRIIEIDD
jgi:hypothetical protein